MQSTEKPCLFLPVCLSVLLFHSVFSIYPFIPISLSTCLSYLHSPLLKSVFMCVWNCLPIIVANFPKAPATVVRPQTFFHTDTHFCNILNVWVYYVLNLWVNTEQWHSSHCETASFSDVRQKIYVYISHILKWLDCGARETSTWTNK